MVRVSESNSWVELCFLKLCEGLSIVFHISHSTLVITGNGTFAAHCFVIRVLIYALLMLYNSLQMIKIDQNMSEF